MEISASWINNEIFDGNVSRAQHTHTHIPEYRQKNESSRFTQMTFCANDARIKKKNYTEQNDINAHAI